MLITFDDYEVQNAIYTIACRNEGFKTNNEQDEENDKDMMEYFWEEVRKQSHIGFGLEEAISDYLQQQGEFLVGTGKYGYIVDRMECEVFNIKHWEDL